MENEARPENDPPAKPYSKTSEYVKQWTRNNPERYNAIKGRQRKRMREKFIGVLIDGKVKFIEAPGKRPYPEGQKCELCRKGPRQLGYHHWDGNNFSYGMWLCRPCHTVAGKVENGWVERYLGLKDIIEKGGDHNGGQVEA